MVRRMPRRWQQPHMVANHRVIRHQVGPPRLQHRQHGFLEYRRPRLCIRRLPKPHLIRREHIPRVGERRRPFPIHQPRIPPHMIRMQVRAEHIINILEPQSRCLQRQFVSLPLPLVPCRQIRQCLVVPHAGIDQDSVVRRAHHIALKHQDRPVLRVQRLRRQPPPMLRQPLFGQLRQHLPQAHHWSAELHDAMYGQIAGSEPKRTGHGWHLQLPAWGENASASKRASVFLERNRNNLAHVSKADA
jgi:hypothetical protein